MKIGIIGSGAREAAIAWKLRSEAGPANVVVIPGNDGTPGSHPIDPFDFIAIRKFCDESKIELLFVGPEKPLADGIVDAFKDFGIKVLGPDSRSAKLESSKCFAKEFMRKHGVATAPFTSYSDISDARSAAKKDDGKIVIKYDGLAAGKGVFVCDNFPEADKALTSIAENFGENSACVLEKRLSGQEVSVIGFTDGRSIRLFLPAQDHKQLLDGDRGPNTGGMGAFCPLPICDGAVMKQIHRAIIQPTLDGIKEEKMNYFGPIFFGIMLSQDGPKLLEYNVRSGDPETQVMMASLKSDLLPLILGCFDGSLKSVPIEFHPGAFVCVVLAGKNYPSGSSHGEKISGLDFLEPGTLVFHSGTKKIDGDFVTAGGRILSVVAKGGNLNEAREKVYRECGKIWFPGVHYRKDIGDRKKW